MSGANYEIMILYRRLGKKYFCVIVETSKNFYFQRFGANALSLKLDRLIVIALEKKCLDRSGFESFYTFIYRWRALHIFVACVKPVSLKNEGSSYLNS